MVTGNSRFHLVVDSGMTNDELVKSSQGTVVPLDKKLEQRREVKPTKAQLKRQARSRADDIRSRLDAAAEHISTIPILVAEAWNDGDWEALGYSDWETYVQDEFGTSILKLDTAIRKLWVKELASQGMSTREIAPVVNVGKSTVNRDLAVPNGTDDRPEGDDSPVGKDGLVILEDPDNPVLNDSVEVGEACPIVSFTKFYNSVRDFMGDVPTLPYKPEERAKLARYLRKIATQLEGEGK